MLFRAPLVRALVDGRKDVTRRPITRENTVDARTMKRVPRATWDRHKLHIERGRGAPPYAPANPFGVTLVDLDTGAMIPLWPRIHVGDRIWVRERARFMGRRYNPLTLDVTVRYWADDTLRTLQLSHACAEMKIFQGLDRHDWKPVPSLLLPRVATRFLLPVVSVRAERVDQITVKEVFREGYPFFSHSLEEEPYDPIESFQVLWNSIGDRETDTKGWGDGATPVWRYEWSKPVTP